MADVFREIEEKERTDPPPEAKYWGKELDLARKRQRKFRKAAREVVQIYEGEQETENSFNILYSNTETLLPAIYNQLPRPDVDRTFHDAAPLAKMSSEALERVIKNTVDAQNAEYDQFHRLFQQAVLGGLVSGQGVTRIFYDAEIKTTAAPVGDDGGEEGEGEERDGADVAAQDADKKPFLPPKERSRVAYESICGKDLDYDQVLFGYARRWVDVPWLGFEHFMHLDDLVANFGEEIAEDIPLGPYTRGEEGTWKKKGDEDGDDNHGSQPGAYVVEIWNKAKKEVVFFCEAYPEKIIGRPREDPFELSGFYPICEPLKFQMKTSGLIPKPLYKMYESQAKELNRLSMRINRILNAMKVRGFYDGSLQGLKDLLNADDNTLKAVPNASAFTEGKTLANSIWMMPLGELVTVLQQLMMGRESCKNTIYEITGLSDIMRGDTQASETFGAQKLKSKWGTQRLQKFQGEVQRYCRDCYRIVGELAAKNFSPKTFALMTGLPYALADEVKQAQKTMQMVQMAQMQAAQQQGPPVPGQPPPAAPSISPQLQQAAQQAQEVLGKPAWDDVIKLLRVDVARFYQIDIETNSTIDPTRQEDKQDIIDVMTALANTVESFGPLVEQGVFPMAAFKSILGAMTRRFTFGREVEDAIKAIPDQVPQTVNNTPPDQAAKAGPTPEELQAKQAEAQLDLQTVQAKTSLLDKETQRKGMEHDAAMQKINREEELETRRHQLRMAEIDAEMVAAAVKKDATREIANTQVNSARSLAATQINTAKNTSDIKTRDLAAGAAAKQQQREAETSESSTKADTATDIKELVAEMRKPKRHKLVKNPDGSKELVQLTDEAR
jgi:hypothetical protein